MSPQIQVRFDKARRKWVLVITAFSNERAQERRADIHTDAGPHSLPSGEEVGMAIEDLVPEFRRINLL